MAKLKLTAKNTEVESFKDKFYMIKSGNMYTICIKESHALLISHPNFNGALEKFNDLLHRYGTYTTLLRVMRECEYPPTKIPPAVLSKRVQSYKKEGEKYYDDIEHVVDMFNTYNDNKLKEKTKVRPLAVKKKIIKKRA